MTASLDHYSRLVAHVPDVELKGVTLPYTSVNGHMFSFMDASGMLALRLSKEDRDSFIEVYEATMHTAHGTVMKEYVTVPAALLAETASLLPWLEASYRYVAGLQPKRTRRPG